MEIIKAPRELLPHEAKLFELQKLKDITHTGSKNLWCSAESGISKESRNETEEDKLVLVYRHMADKELLVLVSTNQLPNTQPYQTIVQGEEGRSYCLSYLQGKKFVDTHPTCIVEFCCKKEMIDQFFEKQHKPEKGCLSHGLGDKAGKTLQEFNESLLRGDTTWETVVVKRPFKKKK